MGHHRLAILIPLLGRPHRVEPVLRSVFAATADARVVFVTSPDDDAVRTQVRTVLSVFEGVDELVVDGNYAAKVNEAVRHTTEPLLFLGADDLSFHPGWLKAAMERSRGRIGVVSTNDLCNPRVAAGKLATHSLVTREYTKLGTIDDPSRLLHEGYLHEFVDQEFTETAIHRGAFDYAPDAIVEHLHPDVGKAPMDDLYAGQARRMVQGRKVYRRRRRLWT